MSVLRCATAIVTVTAVVPAPKAERRAVTHLVPKRLVRKLPRPRCSSRLRNSAQDAPAVRLCRR
jgi:hypothetical protein